MNPVAWKIVIVGAPLAGKTSIVRRLIYDTFNHDTEGNEKSEMYRKKMYYVENGRKKEVTLLIFDITSKEKKMEKLMNGAKGIMIVGDVTNKNSLKTMDKYARYVKGELGDRPIVFVGNKGDMKYMAEFWEEELEALAKKYHGSYIIVSAKTNYNIREAFELMIDEILKRQN